jgi:hypothetical protein
MEASAMPVKETKEIKRDILSLFRNLSEDDFPILPRYRLLRHCLDPFDTGGRRRFEKAVSELVAQGLVEVQDKPFTRLSLTDKGIDLLH